MPPKRSPATPPLASRIGASFGTGETAGITQPCAKSGGAGAAVAPRGGPQDPPRNLAAMNESRPAAGGQGGGGVGALNPTASAAGSVREVDPATLRWSQTTAGGGGRADPIRRSMADGVYAGDPIDVVETEDGLATVDHTRAAVALERGIKKVPVRVHAPGDPLPAEMSGRPWDSKGTTATTWGEALRIRGAGQRPPIAPTGTPTPPKLPKPKP